MKIYFFCFPFIKEKKTYQRCSYWNELCLRALRQRKTSARQAESAVHWQAQNDNTGREQLLL